MATNSHKQESTRNRSTDKEAIELIADDVLKCLNPLKELIAALKNDDRYRRYDLDIKRINEIESQVNRYEQKLERSQSEKDLGELTSLLTDIFYRFHSSFIGPRKPR